jgi:predicted small metal-binding protein
MARKMADCRRFPSESNCTLTIIGEEEEVVRTAAEHSVSVHGHEDNSELREQIRGILEDESSFTPGTRAQEPLPG